MGCTLPPSSEVEEPAREEFALDRYEISCERARRMLTQAPDQSLSRSGPGDAGRTQRVRDRAADVFWSRFGADAGGRKAGA